MRILFALPLLAAAAAAAEFDCSTVKGSMPKTDTSLCEKHWWESLSDTPDLSEQEALCFHDQRGDIEWGYSKMAMKWDKIVNDLTNAGLKEVAGYCKKHYAQDLEVTTGDKVFNAIGSVVSNSGPANMAAYEVMMENFDSCVWKQAQQKCKCANDPVADLGELAESAGMKTFLSTCLGNNPPSLIYGIADKYTQLLDAQNVKTAEGVMQQYGDMHCDGEKFKEWLVETVGTSQTWADKIQLGVDNYYKNMNKMKCDEASPKEAEAAPPAPAPAPPAPAPPAPAPPAADYQFTVIQVAKYTKPNQDILIMGGKGDCVEAAGGHACDVPVKLADRPADAWPEYNQWNQGADALSWTQDPARTEFKGTKPTGLAMAWTTNDLNDAHYSKYNEVGGGIWEITLDMDCSKLADSNGFFAFRAYMADSNVNPVAEIVEKEFDQAKCDVVGDTFQGKIHTHYAKCGEYNYHIFDLPHCKINPLEQLSAGR